MKHEINANSSGYNSRMVENDSGVPPQIRLMVGTATTGLIRYEWYLARTGMLVPTNWSWIQFAQFMAFGQFAALGYQTDDAQNVICDEAVRGDYEWLLLYEHDMLPAPNTLIGFNEYMKRGDVPVVSALYFTRHIPSEPLVYRGRGTGAYENFELGDLVWADGVPTGMLLVHMSLIRAMWEESEEYMIGTRAVRRIFNAPRMAWYDPETAEFNVTSGTSDLHWCKRVMDEGFFEKSGWPEYQKMQYPFLVDTGIQSDHIDINHGGTIYPPGGIRKYWEAKRKWLEGSLKQDEKEETEEAPTLGVSVSDGVGASTGLK